MYGDTALIGAYGGSDNSKSGSGSVYVFTRSSTDGGTFTQQSKLHANDPAVRIISVFLFLYAVTWQIGAPSATTTVNPCLALYVFTRLVLMGHLQQSKLHASDPAVTDHFGTSVSLYATALIGAYGMTIASFEIWLCVRVPRSSTDSGTFTQQSKLHASDPAADDLFGISVSLYGDTALIGAPGGGDNSKADSGSVYVFRHHLRRRLRHRHYSSRLSWNTRRSRVYASDAA